MNLRQAPWDRKMRVNCKSDELSLASRIAVVEAALLENHNAFQEVQEHHWQEKASGEQCGEGDQAAKDEKDNTKIPPFD